MYYGSIVVSRSLKKFFFENIAHETLFVVNIIGSCFSALEAFNLY